MRHKTSFKQKVCRYSKGAISIFLAVLLLPFYSLAAVLVEAGRYQSSARALDAALGSSAMSALSEYESYLHDRFGLLAVKQTDKKDLINQEVNKYLKLQKTADMAGVSLVSVEAAGVYPLSDPDILKQQIQDYSSVLLPAKLTLDGIQEVLDTFLSSDEMKKKFKDINALSDQLSSGANLLSTEADLFTALENSKSKVDAVAQADAEYDSAYTAFSDSVNALISHLNSEAPPAQDQEAVAQWEKTASELRTAADDAARSYSEAIQGAMDALNALHDSMGAVISEISNLSNKTVAFTAKTSDAMATVETDDPDDTDLQNTIKLNGSLADTTSEVNNTAQRVVDSYTEDSFRQATESLHQEQKKVDEFKAEELTKESAALAESEYHATDLSRFGNAEELDSLFAEMDQGMGEEGGMDILLALLDIVSNLFNTDLFVDGRLNSILDMEYYNSTYGGLPSAKADPEDPDFVTSDAALAQKHQDDIGSFQPSYGPDGQESTGNAKLNSSIDTLESLIDSSSGLEGSGDMSRSDFLKKSSSLLKFGAELCAKVSEIGNIMTNMMNNFLQRELLIGYLAYNLPNRTDYDSGSTLTGFSYSKAALAPLTAESNIPVVGGLMSTSQNYAFCGAELEYIMTGNESEYTNQTSVFMQLWVMRLVLDMVPVLTNSELQGILQNLNGIPVVGSVVMLVCEIVVLLAEPMLDCYVLVNGGDIPIIKLGKGNGIFLCPSGLPNLVSKVINLPSMSEDLKTKIQDKTKKLVDAQAKQTGQSSSGSGSSGISLNKEETGSGVSLDKGDTGSGGSSDSSGKGQSGSSGEKSLKEKALSLLEIDYRTHLVLLMTVLGNEHTYLKRLADMVQCEMTQRNRVSNTTIEQEVSGEYYQFDIDKAYTTIRVKATGSVVPVLPVPTLSDSSQIRMGRVLYRGY